MQPYLFVLPQNRLDRFRLRDPGIRTPSRNDIVLNVFDDTKHIVYSHYGGVHMLFSAMNRDISPGEQGEEHACIGDVTNILHINPYRRMHVSVIFPVFLTESPIVSGNETMFCLGQSDHPVCRPLNIYWTIWIGMYDSDVYHHRCY